MFADGASPPNFPEQGEEFNKEILNLYLEGENPLRSRISSSDNRLVNSYGGVVLKPSPKFDYMNYWAEEMEHLSRTDPDEFLNGFLSTHISQTFDPQLQVLKTLMSNDIDMIDKIPNPTRKGRFINTKIKILYALSSFLSIFYRVIFFISFPYSIALTLLYFSFSFLYVIPIVVSVFVFSSYFILKLLDKTEEVGGNRYFLYIGISAVIIESVLIYKSMIGSVFVVYSLFFLALLLLSSVLSYYFDNRLALNENNLSQRLPEEFRKNGIIGNEKVEEITKFVFAKKIFLKILSEAEPKVDPTCPVCGGTGSVGTKVKCPTCGGSKFIYSPKYGETTTCYSCDGSGYVSESTPCGYCDHGRVRNTEEYDNELKQKINSLIDKISSLDEELQKKVEYVNSEIEHLNQKVVAWNSKIYT